jgi:three-Cys-motif partner protein
VTRHTKLGVEAEFFKKLREGSRVKQRIVIDYFVAYNRVMAPGPRAKVGYADLFAGPGLYRSAEGVTEKSIPILVAEAVIQDPLFRDKVHLWFNEGNPENYNQLKIAIDSVPGIQTLRYRPTVGDKIIDARWADKLRKLSVPTLVFLDPCGYKGLSLKLVASILRGFGNDCIFFFNYSRINMKLDLAIMNRSVDEFFEPERAKILRAKIQNRSPAEREEVILAAVKASITEAGAIPLDFGFSSDSGRRSHYLVYASKDQSAAHMMKIILRSASSVVTEGVGSGEHNPRAAAQGPSLFGGLYEVETRLLSVFAGRMITFGSLLQEEAQTNYTESNYRDAVLNLERDGRVTLDPPDVGSACGKKAVAGRRRKANASKKYFNKVHARGKSCQLNRRSNGLRLPGTHPPDAMR